LQDGFDELAAPVTDPTVKSFHSFQDMSSFTFPLSDGKTARTCPAALGYSFAGGTTDGPGAFDFTQNENDTTKVNPFWEAVRDVLRAPGPEQIDCQKPKPILLNGGEITIPYQWAPNIVDIQLLRVGQLFIIVSPSEATTMSGRRWRAAINQTAIDMSLTTNPPMVVLGGPANTYAHYVTTEEEYGIQRYEGASTFYGPHTLNAYINLTVSNMGYLAASSTTQPPAGPLPPNNVDSSLSFIPGVVYDNPPLFKSFGDVLTEPNSSYTSGDNISVSFVGANPHNNLRLEETFTAVKKLSGTGTWVRARDDSDWSLVYTWKREDVVLGTSSVRIDWESEGDAEVGTYRIVYYGDSKEVGGSITAFEGVTRSFTLA
jgi:neutral ceramidase